MTRGTAQGIERVGEATYYEIIEGLYSPEAKLEAERMYARYRGAAIHHALTNRAPKFDRVVGYLPYVTMRNYTGSFVEVGLNPEVQEMIHSIAALSTPMFERLSVQASDWIGTAIRHAWAHVQFERAGKRVYEIHPNLAPKLLETELRGLRGADLRLPHRSIYFQIPREAGLTIRNQLSGVHTLRGAVVTEDADPDPCWRILLWGEPNNGDVLDDALFHFSVYIDPEEDLASCLDRSEARALEQISPEGRRAFMPHWRTLFRLIMNAVVYITWPDAELREWVAPEWVAVRAQMEKHPKGSHKRSRLLEKLAATPARRRIILGASTQPLEREARASPGPLTVRVLVSGHWRMQPHGEGRALRRRQWIEPFWRGPEFGSEPDSRPAVVG